MAAKIKLFDHICKSQAGLWSCKSEPQLASELERLCNEHFDSAAVYVVDPDEQGAKHLAQLLGAEIIWISEPKPDDPNEPERVY